MEYQFQTIEDPKIKKISAQQVTDEYKEYCWVSPKHIPVTPLGSDWKPKPCVLVPKYKTIADRIKNFQVRKDDVWLISYPKTGTTWSQEMVWCICNNLNFEKAKEIDLFERFPYIEVEGFADVPFSVKPLDLVEKMPSPRFIKSHLPVALLPDQMWTVKPKIVYIRRNPKDTAVSFYHHHRLFHGYTGNLVDFMDAFIDDLCLYSPYHEHIMEFCELAKTESNILLLRYEDMKNNLSEIIKTTASFFNIEIKGEDIKTLMEHLSLKSMRENSSTNFEKLANFVLKKNEIEKTDNMRFIRKGQVGGYKDELSAEHVARLDEITNGKVKTEEQLDWFSEN